MRSLRILLVGYGAMGREIEACLLQRNHTVAAIVDPHVAGQTAELALLNNQEVDVAIDFSTRDAFLQQYNYYITHRMAVVIGTTGWYQHFDAVSAAFTDGDCSCVYGTNFSLGAQMFLKLVGRATELLGASTEYDFMLHELHHQRKTDSPSGTAKSAADVVIARHPRKDTVVSGSLSRAIKQNELHVASVRGGAIPGVHTLTIDSAFDTITLSHSARTRAGFALGAVLAAEWIGDHAGVHDITDVIESIAGGGP